MLLVTPPNIKYHHPLIPLGILYIGDALSKSDVEYEFIDLSFYSTPLKSLTDKLERFQPDIVGLSIRNIAETKKTNDIYQDICEIVNVAQRYSKVILGGAGFSIFPNEIMHMTKAEYGIVGPGETAILHIINNLTNMASGSLISKCDDSFITSDISEPLRKYWNQYGKYFILNGAVMPIQTTRGCKFSCRYCTYPSLSNHVIQRRPIEFIITEIKNIIGYTKRNSFYFVDSVFNMDIEYTKTLLKGIVTSELKVQWSCCINPMNYDDKMIELMKKAGCEHCEVGIDSFSDKQLRAMNKGFNSDQAKGLLKGLEQHELPYSISLILGGLGETERTLSETIDAAESLKNVKINAFVGERIYPGTPLQKALTAHKTEFYIAGGDSIYVEGSVVPLIKSTINNCSPERWSFTGELL